MTCDFHIVFRLCPLYRHLFEEDPVGLALHMPSLESLGTFNFLSADLIKEKESERWI